MPISRALDARVELRTPDGVERKLRLVDISVNDLCFEVPSDVPTFATGANLADVRVCVAHFTVECHLAVLRTWKQFDSATHCGARLYPKNESDQNELVSLIAALDATRPGSG
jgi:hypothetical protein